LKPKLYMETTIPSYLTAWPSRDLIRAGHQQITKEWWQTRRERFDIYISRFVLDESAAGDSEAARERLLALQDFPLLDLTDEVGDLAAALATSLSLPPKAVTTRPTSPMPPSTGCTFCSPGTARTSPTPRWPSPSKTPAASAALPVRSFARPKN
jgi:hypothetical protein